MNTYRTLIVLLGVALLATGCAGLREPARVKATEEQRDAHAAAVAVIVDDPRSARRALEAFVKRWPESPLAPDASARLGQLALQRGDEGAALRHFAFIVDEHPGSRPVDSARVELAKLYQARGDREAAAKVLARARLSQLSDDEQREAYRLLADVAPDPVAQIRWLGQLRAVEPDEDTQALIDVEIDELLLSMDASELTRASEQIGKQIPGARILLKAADLALDEGDLSLARRNLSRAGRLPIAPQYNARLAAVTERLRLREDGPLEEIELPSLADAARGDLPSTRGASGTLGVVLPLSGPYARLGEESLHGVLLAAGVFGPIPKGGAASHVRVLVRDSAGRPDRAAEAVRQLAREDEVAAIIGPLLSGECEAAAAAADSAGIPLLALSAREEISRSRPNVFRVRTIPKEEVGALVRHAMQNLDAQRFAILYPRDAYGRGLRRLFWQAVEAQGGHVVGIASYDPDANDFAGPIRRLVGYEMLTPGEKEALAEREKMMRRARRLPPEEASALRVEARALTGPEGELLPPIVDFDALFIPESHEKIVLIAPQLAYHEAVGARLLGPNGWYHPDLVRIARKHVEGAVFTALFFPDSPLPFVQAFTRRYESTFAVEPDVFGAQAYDAANLVLVQLARGLSSRQAVRDGLLSVQGYPGVTGVLSMRADGNARKRPFLLGIERGRIGQLD
jgi:ABC-type branched-subunit amino acid transport system substrate-binding protein